MKLIPISEPNIGPKELRYVTDAVRSGWVSSLGKYINQFESEFSKYCNRKYGLATSNGTVALHLALLALGVGRGDEVIVPDFTFIATASAVTYTGARPVFVDAEQDTWNIDPDKIEAKITRRTKAIIVVHIYGHSCDMDPIMKIAKKYKLKVVEDAAEAHGGLYKGKKIGSFGDVSCFSFYGNKTITTGEGGICLTNDKKLLEKMSILRDHAMSPKKRYWHDEIGYNYRMTNLQAALGVAQLSRIDEFLKIKRKIAEIYNHNLASIKGIVLPVEKKYAFHTYWMYSLLLPKGTSREKIMKLMKKKGVDSRPFFYPLSELPPFKISNKSEFTIARDIAYRGISIPSSTKLTKTDAEYVCKVLKEILK